MKQKLAALLLTVLAGSTASPGASAVDDIFVDGFDTVLSCYGPTGSDRLEVANMTYGPVDQNFRLDVDVTEWDNIFGHGNPFDGITPWPGVIGTSPVTHTLARTEYMTIHFNTGAAPNGRYGWLIYPSNSGGLSGANPPDIQAKISTTCGDFSAPQPGEQTACFKQRAYSDDTRFLSWRIGSGTNPIYCYLAPNTDYWINIKPYNPNQTLPDWPLMILSQWGG